MKRIHIALASADIAATVEDYNTRLGCEASLIVADEYALWRTPTINLSVRKDTTCAPGELRHLGFEDSDAPGFSSTTDANGIVWERFTAQQQADEIEDAWPGTGYKAAD